MEHVLHTGGHIAGEYATLREALREELRHSGRPTKAEAIFREWVGARPLSKPEEALKALLGDIELTKAGRTAGGLPKAVARATSGVSKVDIWFETYEVLDAVRKWHRSSGIERERNAERIWVELAGAGGRLGGSAVGSVSGAAIGGAGGGLLPVPGGAPVGGIVGGLIGLTKGGEWGEALAERHTERLLREFREKDNPAREAGRRLLRDLPADYFKRDFERYRSQIGR
ncbi:MAG: hypothetical protein HY726_10645 [Candidatus Rokubacteria bacterium]|nr:hypothetical protein [Deltaproteobacteria bacterium]MBI4609458.1 hypothetical protein [Candidatus Rokubacteria bacterium]